MKSIPPAQKQFLRSSLFHLWDTLPESTTISVVENKESQPIAVLTVNSETAAVQIPRNFPPPSSALTRDAAVEFLIQQLQEKGDMICVEKANEIVRFRRRGNSMVRETVPHRPIVAKTPLWAVGKTTHLELNQAAPLLQTIGLMTPEGEIKAPMRKKFKQVNHFLDLLSPGLGKKSSPKPYSIVDCGCGKSYLGFVLFWYIRKVLQLPATFLGIDVSEKLIRECRERAKRLSLREMLFECSSIRNAGFPQEIDLLISLHACDTATDEAIACGVVEQARRIVVAPCCQHEIAEKLSGIPHYPLTRHGLFTQRFGDLLTDMLRALFLEAQGYTVTIGEFIGAEDTPKNLLLRAERGNSLAQIRMQEYESFKNYYSLFPEIDRLKQERELLRQIR